MKQEKWKHVQRLLNFELLDEQIAKMAGVRVGEIDKIRSAIDQQDSCPNCQRTIHHLTHYWSDIRQTNDQLDVPLLHLFHVTGPDQRANSKTHWCLTIGGRSPWDVMRKAISSAIDEGKLTRRPRLFPDGLGWMDLSISYCKSVSPQVLDDPQQADELKLPDLGRRAIFV